MADAWSPVSRSEVASILEDATRSVLESGERVLAATLAYRTVPPFVHMFLGGRFHDRLWFLRESRGYIDNDVPHQLRPPSFARGPYCAAVTNLRFMLSALYVNPPLPEYYAARSVVTVARVRHSMGGAIWFRLRMGSEGPMWLRSPREWASRSEDLLIQLKTS
jgi:hypothetical protein